MSDALRMEWVRVRTVRSTYVLGVIGLLLGLAVAALLAAASRPDPLDREFLELVLTSGSVFVPLPFVAVMAGVLGVLTVGHDYRHGLVQPVLLAVPRRGAVMAARLTVLAVIGVVLAVVSMLLNYGLGVAIASSASPSGATVRVMAGYVVYVVLWAWLAAGATWLLRNTAGVLVLLLVVPLIVEPFLQILAQIDQLDWLQPIVRWLPFDAGKALLLGDSAGLVETSSGPSALSGGAVFAGLALVLVVAGGLRFSRNDA